MRKKITFLIFGIIFTIIFLAFTWDQVFHYTALLSKVNYIFYDATFKLFHRSNKTENIVIVDIDEPSLQAEGKWPWPRDKVAALAANLQEAGAAVIAFDVLFPEPDLNPAQVLLNYVAQNKNVATNIPEYLEQHLLNFNNDKVLADVLAKGDVILGVFFNNDLANSTGALGKPLMTIDPELQFVIPKMHRFTGNIPILIDAAHNNGFTTTIPDEDGVVRRSPLLIQYQNALYPSLGLEAVRLYLLANKITLDYKMLNQQQLLLGVQLADIYIPTDFSGSILVPYAGTAYSMPYISATLVLHKRVRPEVFSGKIVFIGASAVGIGDLHPITLQAAGYPGVEIHANIAASILNRNFISSPVWLIGLERVMLIVFGILFTFLALFSTVFTSVLLAIIGEIVVFLTQAYFWHRWNWVFPHIVLSYFQIFFLGASNIVYGYLFETRYRKKLHEVYGQYVSSRYIEKMIDNPEHYTMAGHSKNMSVLFSDVRGFTSLAEKLDAEGVKNFLNSLFTPLTEIIFEQKGTIDKYVGDMVMAFWNDPIEDPEHAQHAVEAALKMISKVEELSPVFADMGIMNVRVGVGVNTGVMSVGDMGSKYRKAYTVLGDAVNLASRLESANKFYGTQILVSEATKNACHGIIFRFVDLVRVKGKTIPIKIFEPLCFESATSSCSTEEFAEYEKALNLYYADDFCQAKVAFEDLSNKYPNVALYKVYCERLAKLTTCPPPKDWGGAYQLGQK